ncbi:MAG: DUF4861 family protein [Ignavibacteria bacterium]|jgi:hypothetical protein
MKTKINFTFVLLLITSTLFAQSISVTVTNNSKQNKADQVVEVDLQQLLEKSKIKDVEKITVLGNDNSVLISQLYDSDFNGEFDLLLFQDSFSEGEQKEYTVKTAGEKPEFESKVYAKFVEGREDIAWESDKAAFRMYGPPLAAEVDNGIDVWSKSVSYLIVDKWYRLEEEGVSSYHDDNGEGADFFSVGKSLGCGGSALKVDGKLYQSGVYKTYKILANGPLRLAFQLNYEFEVNEQKVTEQKVVTMDAGSQLNKIEAVYESAPSDAAFVFGLVKTNRTKSSSSFKNSVISLWGDMTDNKENGGIGTGALSINPSDLQIVEDSTHLYISQSLTEKNIYYAGACWDKADEIKSDKEWRKYLKDFKKSILNPVVIVIN